MTFLRNWFSCLLVLVLSLEASIQLPAQSALPCSGMNPFTVEVNGSSVVGLPMDTAVCPGQSISITLQTFDPDPQDSVFISANVSIPGAIFEIIEGRLPTATFSWNPARKDAGFHFFKVTFRDDCIPPTQRSYSFSVEVRNPIIVIPEQLAVCNGSPARLDSSMVFESVDFANYTWLPTSGVSNPHSRYATFNPSTDQVYTLVATNGYCSDTASMEVRVLELDTAVSTSLNSLVSLEPDASYQWVDCNQGNVPIAGATGQSFTPAVSGSYAVMLKRDGCEEMSACYEMVLDSLTGLVAFYFFPNPTSGIIHLVTQANQTVSINLELVDMLGQSVYRETLIVDAGIASRAVPLPESAIGLYTLLLEDAESRLVRKVVIVR